MNHINSRNCFNSMVKSEIKYYFTSRFHTRISKNLVSTYLECWILDRYSILRFDHATKLRHVNLNNSSKNEYTTMTAHALWWSTGFVVITLFLLRLIWQVWLVNPIWQMKLLTTIFQISSSTFLRHCRARRDPRVSHRSTLKTHWTRVAKFVEPRPARFYDTPVTSQVKMPCLTRSASKSPEHLKNALDEGSQICWSSSSSFLRHSSDLPRQDAAPNEIRG